MQLDISVQLDLVLPEPTDFLLQIEAAPLPEQQLISAHIDLSPSLHFARVPGQDEIGDRIWLRAEGHFAIGYRSRMAITRHLADIASLPALPPHQLPGETVQYLMDSRYCPADSFQSFVSAEFGALQGGERIVAMRDWIAANFAYTPGSSHSATTALESFVERRGVCRDYAHVLIALARASAIPARYASVYAPRVMPQDFHAVAEVFLADPHGPGGAWHLVDPTGMAEAGEMAKIGIGRDAADVSFLSSYGPLELSLKTIAVTIA
ncbi:MAG TPA: transglutaminase family protein [Novosphingobium sp.]|nr:transglutaminase family protein [Novosphingobium sp.]